MMDANVKLTVMEWHQLLKVLEQDLSTANSQRFTGVPDAQVERLYTKVVGQLHGGGVVVVDGDALEEVEHE
jgi:hypothetical protein